MIVWKFGDFETQIDFTDADFMRKMNDAYQNLLEESKRVPKTGMIYDIMEAQCTIYDNFFNYIFGPGTSEKMYGKSKSVALRLQSADSLNEIREHQDKEMVQMYMKYLPQNRAQRRNNHKKGKR